MEITKVSGCQRGTQGTHSSKTFGAKIVQGPKKWQVYSIILL